MYYKGFDKDLKCYGFQYEVGKEYIEEDADLYLCACENPIDVLQYYPPVNSRYCEVELVSTDSKHAVKKIRVISEIDIIKIAKEAVKLIFEKIDKSNPIQKRECRSIAINTNIHNKVVNTGDQSTVINTGDKSVAVNEGDWGVATNTGEASIAISKGYQSVAVSTMRPSVATSEGSVSVAVNMGECGVTICEGYSSAAANTGDKSVAVNEGDWGIAVNTGEASIAISEGCASASINTGDGSAAVNNGIRSVGLVIGEDSNAIVSGDDSISCAFGIRCAASGKKGNWIVLCERDDEGKVLNVKAKKVDGEKIKENRLYILRHNKIVEL